LKMQASRMMQFARTSASRCAAVRQVSALSAMVARPVVGGSASQGLRQLHSTRQMFGEGTDNFAAALKHEIDDEAENGDVPDLVSTLGDFAVTGEIGNPIVTMKATSGSDNVTITVDINECSHADAMEDEESEEEVSTGKEPAFTIEIANGATGQTMICKCEAYAEPQDESYTAYPFVIHEVGVKAKGGDVANTYFSDPGYWDDALEESFREFLAEKGVDEEFVEDLCHYVHNKEYADYLSMLQTLKLFADKSS